MLGELDDLKAQTLGELDDLKALSKISHHKGIPMSKKAHGGLERILATRQAPAIMSGVYANTLTNLIPDIYAALDVTSRELVGFIPSVERNMEATRVAVGESIRWPVAPAMTGVDITPSMTVPTPTDRTIGSDTMTLTKSRAYRFGFTGEEQRGLNNGPGYLNAQALLIAQSMRGVVNEIETDLALAAANGACRAYGTAGTTPFGTNLGELAQIRKILDDNGAPLTGRSMVMNTSSGAALRTLGQLTKANEAGTQMTLRDGELLNLHGFSLKESGQAPNKTKGTGTSYTSNTAGYAVGSTSITLITGSGTVLAGDVVTFAGDANKYVVKTGVTAPGTIELQAPGLRVAIPASATAMTIGNSFATNVAFSSNALRLAVRPPALPAEGDAAVDRMVVTDARSGMSFEIRIYAGYNMMMGEVCATWGVKAVKPEHIALLLG